MCECLFGCSDCENRNNIIYLLYNDEGFGYIGKTTHLHARLKLHRHINNECGSKKLGKDFKYMILEDNIEEELLGLKEQYWYDLYNEICKGKLVNKMRPNGRDMDYFEEQKRVEKLERDYWKVLFADEIKKERRKAEKNNKKLRLERMKTEDPIKYKEIQQKKQKAEVERKLRYLWRENDCNTHEEYTAFKEQKKQKTKDKVKLQRATEKYLCECGKQGLKIHIARHLKSCKAQKNIRQILQV